MLAGGQKPLQVAELNGAAILYLYLILTVLYHATPNKTFLFFSIISLKPTMATVSPEIKQVQFTVDWAEENCFSAARAEKRRKDKESIRMAAQQKELCMTGILVVIGNKHNWHDLTTLCFREEIIKGVVWDLVLGRGECVLDSANLTREVLTNLLRRNIPILALSMPIRWKLWKL